MMFRLRTITNTSIWNGEESYYFIDGGNGYKLDISKVGNSVNIKDEFEEVVKVVRNNLSDFSIGKCKVNWLSENPGRANVYEVREIAKNNTLYIPGSSIKGSIVTPLLVAILEGGKLLEEIREAEQEIESKIREKERERFKSILERVEEIIDYIKRIDRRFFEVVAKKGRCNYRERDCKQINALRTLVKSMWTYVATYLIDFSVSDFAPTSVTTEILGLRRVMRRSGPITLIESIAPGSIFKGDIKFYVGGNNKINLLRKCCNKFYKKNFFGKINLCDKVLLNIGFGGGYKNKSMYDVLLSFNKAYSPKTYWNIKLGWVVLE